eukprot:jgi/Mesvir1/11696/Mv00088-RA.1
MGKTATPRAMKISTPKMVDRHSSFCDNLGLGPHCSIWQAMKADMSYYDSDPRFPHALIQEIVDSQPVSPMEMTDDEGGDCNKYFIIEPVKEEPQVTIRPIKSLKDIPAALKSIKSLKDIPALIEATIKSVKSFKELSAAAEVVEPPEVTGEPKRGHLGLVTDAWANVLVTTEGADGQGEQVRVSTAKLLEAGEVLVRAMEALGNCMIMGRREVQKNIGKLRDAFNSDQKRCAMLDALLAHEKATGYVRNDNSGTIGALWLRRCVLFMVGIFDELVHGTASTTLSDAMFAAYRKTLQHYHNWITSKAMTTAMSFGVPSRAEMLAALGPDPARVMEEMRELVEVLSPVLDELGRVFKAAGAE